MQDAEEIAECQRTSVRFMQVYSRISGELNDAPGRRETPGATAEGNGSGGGATLSTTWPIRTTCASGTSDQTGAACSGRGSGKDSPFAPWPCGLPAAPSAASPSAWNARDMLSSCTAGWAWSCAWADEACMTILIDMHVHADMCNSFLDSAAQEVVVFNVLTMAAFSVLQLIPFRHCCKRELFLWEPFSFH
jgi:hypothetical protein